MRRDWLFVYDFDRPEEWVGRFQELVVPKVADIAHEIREQTKWDLSGLDVRISTPAPEAPEKDRLLEVIAKDFGGSHFRAFHATRLLRPARILEDGLRALNRKSQIAQVKAALSDSGVSTQKQRIASWDDWSEETDSLDTQYREGDCWLTPSRTLLHDGGLDLMFERFGGEFMERISGDSFRGSTQADVDIGQPTVVVAAFPVGWCNHTSANGPRRIFYETLKSLGHHLDDSFAPFWDVQVNRDLPPDVIELVCPRDDIRVAARPNVT